MRVNFTRPQKTFSAVKSPPPLPPAVKAAAEAKAQAIAQAAAQAKAAAEEFTRNWDAFFTLYWNHSNGIPEHWLRDFEPNKSIGLRTASDVVLLNQNGRKC